MKPTIYDIMEKEELFKILDKVSTLNMDIDTAEKKIRKSFKEVTDNNATLQKQVEELKENLANVSDTRNYYIKQAEELTKDLETTTKQYWELMNSREPSLLEVAKDYISAAITRNSRFTDDDIKGLINLAQDTIQAVHQAEGRGE